MRTCFEREKKRKAWPTACGSVSLLQRKLSVGYSRAARIVDQLEDAGIVGPFEGSKARQVLLNDEMELDSLLSLTLDGEMLYAGSANGRVYAIAVP